MTDEQITALMKQNVELQEENKAFNEEIETLKVSVEELEKEIKIKHDALREIEDIAGRYS
jgi:predicted RNase H-like nuclease (RuvC/YqgF family)